LARRKSCEIAYPSGYNTWVPSWEATGQVVAFIRDPNRFPINNYVAFRPAKKSVGLWLEFDLDHVARSLSLEQLEWPDGGERPTGEFNLAGFEYKEYRTKRRDLAVALGRKTIAQTDWPILAYHSSMAMMQAMTALTRLTWSVLDTTSNWGTATDTAVNLGSGSGKLDGATATAGDANFLNIKKVFNKAALNILKATNSMVRKSDLWAVMSPTGAKLLSETAEIADFLKQSPFAMGQVRGDLPNRNVLFGLPEMLYGINIAVEDTVFVSSQKGATVSRSFVKNDDQIAFLSKVDALPGDEVGDAPTPNFSTYQVFYYNEALENAPSSSRGNGRGLLSVETWEDVRNKRTEAHVTFDTSEKMVAATSGYLVQDAFASV
jgi:hypothetical protein